MTAGDNQSERHRTIYVTIENWSGIVTLNNHSGGAVVVEGGRVVGVSALARESGIAIGMTLPKARSRTAHLESFDRDLAAEGIAFQGVLDALVEFSPYFSSISPGECSLALRTVLRLFRTEAAVLTELQRHLSTLLRDVERALALSGRVEYRLGVANGIFAARLASRAGVVVPPGATREFVDRCPIEEIGPSAMVDLLVEVGVRTLGSFGGLSKGDVASRFGREGQQAYELVQGEHDLKTLSIPACVDREIHLVFDDDLGEIDQVAFSVGLPLRSLFDELRREGSTPTSLEIALKFDREWVSRLWHFPNGATERDVIDRVRWQIEGLTKQWAHPRDSRDHWDAQMIREIIMRPAVLSPSVGRQLGLSGATQANIEAIRRSLAKISANLGPRGVSQIKETSGRSPQERYTLIPWDEGEGEMELSRRGRRHVLRGESDVQGLPWPGSLPGPQPAIVYERLRPIEVLDTSGEPVRVSGRGEMSADPELLVVGGSSRSKITNYRGPWPIEERWWDQRRRRRYVRCLVELSDKTLHLVVIERQQWYLEATYD